MQLMQIQNFMDEHRTW